MKQARCYEEPCRDWIDVAVHGKDKKINGHGHYGERIWSSGASIYSYGTHFEMARVLYEGKGKKRRPVMILVNGERASNTTTKHQGYVRSAVSRSGLPSVIIPFGAIEAARIDINSVRVLENLTDRQVPTHHESTSKPRHLTYVDRPAYEYATFDDEHRERYLTWGAHKVWQEKLDGLLGQARRLQEKIDDDTTLEYKWEEPFETQLEKVQQQIASHHATTPVVNVTTQHVPPLLIPRGRVQGYVDNRHHTMHGYTADGMARTGLQHTIAMHHPDEDGVWRWTTHRHLLGESLIVADVNATRRVTCKTCEGRKWGDRLPNLPGNMDWLYVDRDDDFPMPGIAHQVPVPHVGDRSNHWERRNFTTTWIQPVLGALPLPMDAYPCKACSGRGWVTRPVKRRAVKFLSGFDHGEPHLAYFFCELPKCDATTVDEAYDALKPDVVKLAEQMDRACVRQGDIFAIPTTLTTKELMADAKRHGVRHLGRAAKMAGAQPAAHQIATGDRWRYTKLDRPIPVYRDADNKKIRAIVGASMLLGTNHQGTEVIHAKDGTIYAKGTMWHVPDGRTNDHVAKKLGDGKTWHIIVKNTVPVRRA